MSPHDRRRVIIVTGSSRGLGREFALRFGRAGDRVIVNYRTDEQTAQAVVDEIARSSGEAVCCRADVTRPSEVDAMINTAVKRWGSVDVLINNAARTSDGIALRMTEDSWDAVIAANLTAPFHALRAAARVMSQLRDGHIINIASIVGIQGREGQANYSASKAGLLGLTRAAALEFGPLNIKVNAVLPGYLPTTMSAQVANAVHDRIIAQHALGRTSDAEETAEFVYQLSLMRNVSGQVFNLDSRII